MLKLSIIIPTFCRPTLLRWGLLSLSKQTLKFPYEIIVLNDGEENDGTKEVTEEFNRKLRIRYIITRLESKNTPLSFRIAGFALNLGIKSAKGKHLLIMSPEMICLDNKIKEMVEILDKDPNLMVIPRGKNDDGRILEKLEVKKDEITSEDFSAQKNNLNTTLPFFMAVNRSKYIEIGGYDEDFVGYCFDDTDFVTRMLEAGCQYQSIEMRVIHLHHSKERKSLLNKAQLYEYNRTLYVQKHANPNVEKIITPIRKWELNKIPKIAHFYWGEEILPYARYLTIYTFSKQNPDWKIKYYYPKIRCKEQMWKTFELKYDISQLKDHTLYLKNLPIDLIEWDFARYLMPNGISEVFKSDLLRWYLLSTVGGLWSDMDVLYFKPMTNLLINTSLNSHLDTLVAINNKYGHSIGFLLSSANNNFYNYILEKTRKYYNPNEYQSLGTGILKPEAGSIEIINRKFPTIHLGNIDNEAVYSYDATMIKLIYNSTSLQYFNSNSIGMHWYAGHPLAGKFTTEITEENYGELENVIGNVIDLCLNQSPKCIDFLLKGDK